MSKVPFVLTEQDEEGNWELADLEPAEEAKQLTVVLSVPEPDKSKEGSNLSGRQKPVLDGSSPATEAPINWDNVASEVKTMLELDPKDPEAGFD
jgi:hypothetical protein